MHSMRSESTNLHMQINLMFHRVILTVVLVTLQTKNFHKNGLHLHNARKNHGWINMTFKNIVSNLWDRHFSYCIATCFGGWDGFRTLKPAVTIWVTEVGLVVISAYFTKLLLRFCVYGTLLATGTFCREQTMNKTGLFSRNL